MSDEHPGDGPGDRSVSPSIPTEARRLHIGADRLGRWLTGFDERHGGSTWTVGSDVVELSAPDGTRGWLEVPFGPLPSLAGPAPRDALLAHVGRTRRVGAILVRRGGYGAGIFDGATLVSSKVGSAYVQGTTKAGGWSQQRFARRRANQARSAFAEAADTAVRVLGAEVGRLDAVVTGGDRAAVDAVLADPRLAGLRPLVSGPLLAVPDPRLRVLQQLPEQFLAVTIRIHP